MLANWVNRHSLTPRQFRCGFCGDKVASAAGYFSEHPPAKRNDKGYIFICPSCEEPNYFCGRERVPSPAPGNDVEHVPPEVHQLYVEARQCVSISAYTASVLASRKLLMNVAVGQGAETGKPFIAYVEFLANNGFVPPNGRPWVDHIRKKGNEATHEIAQMSEADATELITFTEMLLKFIYEFPARVPTEPA